MNELNKAVQYATRLFRYRLRGEKELKNRLQKKGFSTEVTEKIVETFKKEGLIDDEKFVTMWIEDSLDLKKKGKWLIFKDLTEKGIPREYLESIWEKWEAKELSTALELLPKLRRKYRNLEGWELKRKIIEALTKKGFSTNVVRKIQDEL